MTSRLYFGVPALGLRDATGRIMFRLGGAPPERAVLGIDVLAEEFDLGAAASRVLATQMVRVGLLERVTPKGFEFRITEKFRDYTHARIVEPLPRTRAQLLVGHFTDVASEFNRNAANNKCEIEAITVFGAYMLRESELPELSIGVVVRKRSPGDRGSAGRATVQNEGTDEIRTLLESQDNRVIVSFFDKLQDVPRPFSVAFREAG